MAASVAELSIVSLFRRLVWKVDGQDDPLTGNEGGFRLARRQDLFRKAYSVLLGWTEVRSQAHGQPAVSACRIPLCFSGSPTEGQTRVERQTAGSVRALLTGSMTRRRKRWMWTMTRGRSSWHFD